MIHADITTADGEFDIRMSFCPISIAIVSSRPWIMRAVMGSTRVGCSFAMAGPVRLSVLNYTTRAKQRVGVNNMRESL